MFESLSDKLQATLGDLRGRGKLDEETISRAMREIRLALLEADVNFQVVKDFVAQVRERALGEEVMKSITPGQQVVKVVHDLHNMLTGSQTLQDVLAERALTHLADEILDHLEVDVRLEQGEPNLAHRTRDRLLVELAAPAEVAECALEPV